ncbi:hypothetical protein IFM89_021809 [Coptis chinensis]|uniref:Amino acid transporter transmembrane domain-containing protein n=1 Tax=Coptis chinensis TaxID=261450 RepID=A0A835M6X7_9MAGN|nr:hypothetical protein IFM89_021809 [Coptis chinensis]
MGEAVQGTTVRTSDHVNEPASTILDIHTLNNSPTPTQDSAYKNKKPFQLESPKKETIVSVQEECSEGMGKNNAKRKEIPDAWLPITASKNGNAFYSAFHSVNSGIGFQALVLPFAFSIIGWTWGIICMLVAFGWQYYTKWLLIQLHESVPGRRFNRYLQLVKVAFGETPGKLLGLFPVMYLAGGSCVMLIINAGVSMKLFIKTICGDTCKSPPLTTVECYLMFICLAIILTQVPSLNSIAWFSFIGGMTAVLYCTLLWTIPLSKSRPTGISFDTAKSQSGISSPFDTFTAIGIIVFAFRGHNLVLEIQATLPSSEKYPSRAPMWKGVNFAYPIIVMCLFPLALAGYWAYGNKIPATGMLIALHSIHKNDTSRFLLGLTSLLVVIHSLTAFQIYSIPILDNLEFAYTSKKNKPCPMLIHAGFRVFFGCLTCFIAVAIPFIKVLAAIIGSVALLLTFAYPCFIWIAIKKPKRFSAMWCINMVLGSLGVVLSILVFAGCIRSVTHTGIQVGFFKP